VCTRLPATSEALYHVYTVSDVVTARDATRWRSDTPVHVTRASSRHTETLGLQRLVLLLLLMTCGTRIEAFEFPKELSCICDTSRGTVQFSDGCVCVRVCACVHACARVVVNQ